MAKRGNPYHKPPGTSEGGEFTNAPGNTKNLEIKKARTKRGDIAYGLYDNGKPISWHGTREGAKNAVLYLRHGSDIAQGMIDKKNFRWVKNLSDAMK
jgi:hypothetical protein